MAARFPDDIELSLISAEELEEDAIPDKDSLSSKEKNHVVTSSKTILRKCGFNDKEVEQIARVSPTRLQERAETAAKLHKAKFEKSHIKQIIITDVPSSQKKLQQMITKSSSALTSHRMMNSGAKSSSGSNHFVRSSSSKGNEAEPPTTDEDKELLKDLPSPLSEGIFDVFLLFCEGDDPEAMKLFHFLQEVLKLKVCVLDEHGFFTKMRWRFERLEAAIRRSLFTFIFVTQRMCNDKTWARYHGMAALAEAIESNAEFVVPVRAENCSVPFHLQPLTSLRVYHIMQDLPDHPDFRDPNDSTSQTPSRQLPFVSKQILALVTSRQDVKREKVRRDKEEIEQWLYDEKLRRFRKELQRKNEAAVRKEQFELQRRQIEKEERENMERRKREEAEQLRRKRSQDVRRPQPSRDRVPVSAPGTRQRPEPRFDPLTKELQGIHITNYVFPNVENASDLAPRPTYNVQANQISNVQLGDKNKIVEASGSEAAPIAWKAPAAVPPPPVNYAQPTSGQSNSTADAIYDGRSTDNYIGSESLEQDELSLPEAREAPQVPFSDYEGERKTFEPASGTFAQTVRKEAVETGSLELSSSTGSIPPQGDPFADDVTPQGRDPFASDPSFSSLSTRQSDPFESDTTTSSLSSYSESEFEGTRHVSDQTSRDPPLQTPDEHVAPPGGELQSLSVHNFQSAEAHLRDPPVQRDPFEENAPQLQPMDLISDPGEELDAFSIRSVPGRRVVGPNAQYRATNSGERTTGRLENNSSDVNFNVVSAHPRS